MNELFDAKESLPSTEREESLFQRLPTLIENAKAHSDHYAKLFADIDHTAVSCREGLSKLPITRKFNVPSQQQLKPPFGGLNSVAIGRWRVCFNLRGPCMRRKRMNRTSGVWDARFMPQDFAVVIWSTTRSLITSLRVDSLWMAVLERVAARYFRLG